LNYNRWLNISIVSGIIAVILIYYSIFTDSNIHGYVGMGIFTITLIGKYKNYKEDKMKKERFG